MTHRGAAVWKAWWQDSTPPGLAERIALVIKALGLRRRSNDYPRVFGLKINAIWKYRRGISRPKVRFIVRLHRLEEIYAQEIKRMREAELAYGGFKKIPTEVLESLWARANKGIKKD